MLVFLSWFGMFLLISASLIVGGEVDELITLAAEEGGFGEWESEVLGEEVGWFGWLKAFVSG